MSALDIVSTGPIDTPRLSRLRERGEGLLSWVVGITLLVLTAGLYFGGYDYVQGKLQGVLVSWAISNTMGDVRTNIAAGTGQYDSGNLYQAVKNAKAYPWFASPDDASQSFNIMLGGEMQIVGAGSTFQINMTNLAQPVCMSATIKNYGQKSVQINTSTFTPRASSVQASANCIDGMNAFGVTAS